MHWSKLDDRGIWLITYNENLHCLFAIPSDFILLEIDYPIIKQLPPYQNQGILAKQCF